MEQTDGVIIKHSRYRLKYRMPELPHFILDYYCVRTNKFISIMCAPGKATTVRRFVISHPLMVILYQADTTRHCYDWSR